ncbi:riboflavin synthase [Candidatus Bipolaricaulota sp. J31]
MFTGIVREVGKVIERGGNRLVIAVGALELSLGDSVAVNGACLTVVEVRGRHIRFDISRETWERTALGDLRPGDFVNLEPALRLGESLGGHLVLGHVDTVGKIVAIVPRGEGKVLRIAYPVQYSPLVVEKGAVAVDGISLTPFAVEDGVFHVAIVPFTWEKTNLKHRRPGDRVNLEFDIIGKYVRGWRRG